MRHRAVKLSTYQTALLKHQKGWHCCPDRVGLLNTGWNLNTRAAFCYSITFKMVSKSCCFYLRLIEAAASSRDKTAWLCDMCIPVKCKPVSSHCCLCVMKLKHLENPHVSNKEIWHRRCISSISFLFLYCIQIANSHHQFTLTERSSWISKWHYYNGIFENNTFRNAPPVPITRLPLPS